MSQRFLSLFLLAALCATQLSHWSQAEPRARSVSTGVVRAERVVDIATKRQERITAIHVERGDRVDAGALLIETDATELLADQAAAEAEFGAARVERDYRARSTDRLERLARSESLSEDRLDEARYGLAAAEQRLKLAEARLQKVEALLRDARLTAPFAGVVVERAAELGQLTQPGATLLRLEDQSQLKLHTRINELDIPHVNPGDPVQVTIDALGGTPLQGTVATVIPSGDADHTFLVEIGLPTRAGLYPGMFGKAVFGD